VHNTQKGCYRTTGGAKLKEVLATRLTPIHVFSVLEYIVVRLSYNVKLGDKDHNTCKIGVLIRLFSLATSSCALAVVMYYSN
jgi:hypothetical protein